MRKIAKYIATLGFIGFMPVAPGTFASALAVPLCVLLSGWPVFYTVATVLLIVGGVWASSMAEEALGVKDAPQIVIDEFSAMFIAYFFIPPTPAFIITGFILFRFFDILKIPPIKKIHSLPKGYGIMLDDLAAAIFTNLILRALLYMPCLI